MTETAIDAPDLVALSKYKSFLFFELRYLNHQLKTLATGEEDLASSYPDLNRLGLDAASRAETVLPALGIDPHSDRE